MVAVAGTKSRLVSEAVSVTVRFVVSAPPTFCSVKLTVTVSPESTTPFVGPHDSNAKVAEILVTSGAVKRGTKASIKLVPFGVPQPVQRS